MLYLLLIAPSRDCSEVNELLRERNDLRSSLQAHISELSSTNHLISALRQRIGVLQELLTKAETETETEQQQLQHLQVTEEGDSQGWLGSVDAADGEKSYVTSVTDGSQTISSGNQTVALSNLSSDLPLLSSVTSPLHLCHLRNSSFFLRFSILQRRLRRLEGENLDEKKRNALLLQQVESQWKRIQQIQIEMKQMHYQTEQTDRITMTAATAATTAATRKEEEQQMGSDGTIGHISSADRFSSAVDTSLLLLQLHRLRQRCLYLQMANVVAMRRFYLRAAVVSGVILLAAAVAIGIGSMFAMED